MPPLYIRGGPEVPLPTERPWRKPINVSRCTPCRIRIEAHGRLHLREVPQHLGDSDHLNRISTRCSGYCFHTFLYSVLTYSTRSVLASTTSSRTCKWCHVSDGRVRCVLFCPTGYRCLYRCRTIWWRAIVTGCPETKRGSSPDRKDFN